MCGEQEGVSSKSECSRCARGGVVSHEMRCRRADTKKLAAKQREVRRALHPSLAALCLSRPRSAWRSAFALSTQFDSLSMFRCSVVRLSVVRFSIAARSQFGRFSSIPRIIAAQSWAGAGKSTSVLICAVAWAAPYAAPPRLCPRGHFAQMSHLPAMPFGQPPGISFWPTFAGHAFSSESSCEGLGEAIETGSPRDATPSAICSRQSLWISPER